MGWEDERLQRLLDDVDGLDDGAGNGIDPDLYEDTLTENEELQARLCTAVDCLAHIVETRIGPRFPYCDRCQAAIDFLVVEQRRRAA